MTDAAPRNSSLAKQIPRFLVVGFSAVFVDFFTYSILIGFLSYAPAKALSFISGTVVAYIFNKYWTFEQKAHSAREAVRFAILYAATLCINVGVNELSLMLFPGFVSLAFLAATGVSTVLNFTGQKRWVFRADPHASDNPRP